MMYDVTRWFWFVGDERGKVWSSLAGAYVPVTDRDYLAFVDAGGGTQTIPTLGDLRRIFADNYPAGMLVTYAASKRWEKEVAGITVAGVPVATDDRSKQMLIGARMMAANDPDFTTPWVGVDGNVYPLGAAEIVAVSDAVSMHVASCFAIFADVSAGIDSGAIKTRSEIDAAFA